MLIDRREEGLYDGPIMYFYLHLCKFAKTEIHGKNLKIAQILL